MFTLGWLSIFELFWLLLHSPFSPKGFSIPHKKTNAPQAIGERLFSGCALIKSGSTL